MEVLCKAVLAVCCILLHLHFAISESIESSEDSNTSLSIFSSRFQNVCEKETTFGTVVNSDRKVLLKWKRARSSTHQKSEPLCTDKNDKILTRYCSENGWGVTPNCTNIINYCPKNFAYHNDFCVQTQKGSYENGCGIPTNLYDAQIYRPWALIHEQVWLPDIKFDKDGLQLAFAQNNSKYLQIESGYCPALIQGKLNHYDCNSPLDHICLYEPDYFLHQCPTDCKPAGLNTAYCYCKQSEPCNHRPASPKFYHQIMMLKQLSGKDQCYFDNHDHGHTNFNRSAKKARNCYLCEVEALNYPLSRLKLEYKYKKRRLYLTMTSPEGLQQFNSSLLAQCFKDSGTFEAVNILKTITHKTRGLRAEKHAPDALVVYELELNEKPAEYFCIARQKPDLNVLKSNTIVAHKKSKLYIFVVQLHSMTPRDLNNLRSSLNQWGHRVTLEVFRAFPIKTTGRFTYLLHITQGNHNNVYGEYYKLQKNFRRFVATSASGGVQLDFFRSAYECFPDITIALNSTVRWKKAIIGATAYSSDVCLQNNGLPLTRKCVGNFTYGAYWDNVQGKCSQSYKKTPITEYLEKYANEDVDLNENLVQNLTTVAKEDLKTYDLNLLTDLIGKPFPDNTSSDFLQIVSDVMKKERTYLNESQLIFKTTDKLLDKIDSFFVTNDDHPYDLKRTENFILQVSNPFLTNVTGLAVYGNKNDTFDKLQMRNITRHTTQDDLSLFDNLQFATYVPNNLLEILTENVSVAERNNWQIIVAIFFNDSLFNSNNLTQRIDGSVISVLMPQSSDDYFQESIPLYFNSSKESTCAFWDYEPGIATKESFWSEDGNTFQNMTGPNVVHCEFNHLTHYGLLITSQKPTVTISYENGTVTEEITMEDPNVSILNVITYVCCGLSLLGIIAIFITSALFRSFRKKLGSKILLQMSVAISLEIVLMHLIGNFINPYESTFACSMLAVSLHYAVLSKFSWMLISAYLQYQRFVVVIRPPPKKILLKTFIFGWIVPLIPVLLVYFLSSQNYQAGKQKFCYPKDLSLYIGVLLPALLIVVSNIIIFCIIMYNVSHPKQKIIGSSSEHKYQIYLAVLLFFLLGIPWVFGILAEIVAMTWLYTIFLYLFCIFATLQGFVIFIFYVVLDKETRLLFKRKLHIEESSNNRTKSTSNLAHSKTSASVD